MRQILLTGIIGLALLASNGCSYLFYPHAKDFTGKAKGANTVETLINLTNMMEASAKAGQNGRGDDQAFNDLHNQLHAFDNTICDVDKDKQETPAYALAVTHNKEQWAIFKRVWKFKSDQPQRSQHLELFVSELQELRESLQALR
ncbi:MAG TPA: hypothetical protein VM842_05635 [Nitrospira sp.]|jgi:hypothetical protein|nr:hypothetical protein [Nitrospira sp.]